MAEWYVYALGIFASGLGLLLVYLLLRQQKIIGSIPILSNLVDPIVFGQHALRVTSIETGEEFGYRWKWNKDMDFEEVEEQIYFGQDSDLYYSAKLEELADKHGFKEDTQAESQTEVFYNRAKGKYYSLDEVTPENGKVFQQGNFKGQKKIMMITEYDLKNEKLKVHVQGEPTFKEIRNRPEMND